MEQRRGGSLCRAKSMRCVSGGMHGLHACGRPAASRRLDHPEPSLRHHLHKETFAFKLTYGTSHAAAACMLAAGAGTLPRHMQRYPASHASTINPVSTASSPPQLPQPCMSAAQPPSAPPTSSIPRTPAARAVCCAVQHAQQSFPAYGWVMHTCMHAERRHSSAGGGHSGTHRVEYHTWPFVVEGGGAEDTAAGRGRGPACCASAPAPTPLRLMIF